MPLELNGLSAQQQLDEIAKMAYGSGRLEGTRGGAGNVGLLNGRIVKFNTHAGERRSSSTTDEMRASSDELRTRLANLAATLLQPAENETPEAARLRQRALASICRDLKVDPETHQIGTRKLLSRTIVAKVITKLSEATGHDAWAGLRGADRRAFSSHGLDTHFSTVSKLAKLPETVNAALDTLEHPADGKPGVTLNREERAFLTNLISRDLEARRAAGKSLPSLDEIANSISSFSSRALVLTLQTFNKASVLLQDSRTLVKHMSGHTVYLAGSPEMQRSDRAEVMLMLGNLPSKHSNDLGWTASLVCEKIPEMRQLQPQGALTLETAWQACFHEPPPKLEEGSEALAEAFRKRMLQSLDQMRTAIDPQRTAAKPLNAFLEINLKALFAGKAFSSVVRSAMQDPTFTPDSRRDFVAHPPFYPVDDAAIKTDDHIQDQLALDIGRQELVVKFRTDEGVQTLDLRGTTSENSKEKAQELMQRIDAFLGPDATHEQRNVVMFGLTQAAFSPFVAVIGVGGEHSPATIELSHVAGGNGAVDLSYRSSKDCPVDAAYCYRVAADGANRQEGLPTGQLRPEADRRRVQAEKPVAAERFANLATEVFDAKLAEVRSTLQFSGAAEARCFDTAMARARDKIVKGARTLLTGAWAAEETPEGRNAIQQRAAIVLQERVDRVFRDPAGAARKEALDAVWMGIFKLDLESDDRQRAMAAVRRLPAEEFFALMDDKTERPGQFRTKVQEMSLSMPREDLNEAGCAALIQRLLPTAREQAFTFERSFGSTEKDLARGTVMTLDGQPYGKTTGDFDSGAYRAAVLNTFGNDEGLVRVFNAIAHQGFAASMIVGRATSADAMTPEGIGRFYTPFTQVQDQDLFFDLQTCGNDVYDITCRVRMTGLMSNPIDGQMHPLDPEQSYDTAEATVRLAKVAPGTPNALTATYTDRNGDAQTFHYTLDVVAASAERQVKFLPETV